MKSPSIHSNKGLLTVAALGLSLTVMSSGIALAQTADLRAVSPVMALKTGAMSKVGTDLANLYQQQDAIAARGARVSPSAAESSNALVQVSGGMVVIDAVAAEDAEALLVDLEALGLLNGARFGNVVSGQLPVASIAAAAGLESLQFARPAMAMTRVGSVTSQGDRAMRSDEARDEEEVNGRGITVGVLSDSYDCLGGAAADIAGGDLPRASRITILAEGGCAGAIDEGRGMMQLVRDVAPGASQAFHTAFAGQANFAQGILDLANVAGADIIVDDVIYFAEPMFQDGIIAQAVDAVKAQGVAYFSSAGNSGRNSWESGERGFVDSGVPGLFFGATRHDFDPGPGVDDLQSLFLASGVTRFALQWDEPYFSVSGPPGPANDIDIILYGRDPLGNLTVVAGSAFNNIGADPWEVFEYDNQGPPGVFELGIEKFSGPAPGFMKYVIFDPSGPDITDPATSFPIDFPTDSGTNYGHSNAEGAAGVAAAFWRNTPEFGVSPPEPEVFTAAGGIPIFFDTDGNRIATVVRDQPRFTGPDGGVTTFFGGRDSFGTRTPGGNHFFGTSASAPHVAAVAALMLDANGSLTPDVIYDILGDTAIDMDDPFTPGFDNGFDFLTGDGFVNAEKAVEEAEEYDDDDDEMASLDSDD